MHPRMILNDFLCPYRVKNGFIGVGYNGGGEAILRTAVNFFGDTFWLKLVVIFLLIF